MLHAEHVLAPLRTMRARLDANATEALRPEAVAAVLAALQVPGNPASVHESGREARAVLERARATIAGRFGAMAAGVVFTSGGTEADALAIHGLGGGRRLILGRTEHDAVREAGALREAGHGAAGAEGPLWLPVDREGVAQLDVLAALLRAAGPALVCLMLANNETGAIQPIAAAARLCREHGALLHVDAVQAAGRIPVSLRALGAHALALSSHKLGGPKGAGALLLAPEVAPAPLIRGGGQERGRRGGTPALPAIAGFAAAAEAAGDGAERGVRLAGLRDAIERAAVACGAVVCGGGAPRLPNTTCLALPGRRAERQVIALDLAGVEVSAGAACSSGKVARSHVLEAMGLGSLAGEAIRVSLPWDAGEADVAAFASAYSAMAGRG